MGIIQIIRNQRGNPDALVVFEELNREKEAREEPLFANPRNAASGTLKLQNSHRSIQKAGCLSLLSIGRGIALRRPLRESASRRQLGFKTSEHTRKAHSLEEVFEYINYWDTERKNLPVATDGIVLKVNSLRQQRIWDSQPSLPDGPSHTNSRQNGH